MSRVAQYLVDAYVNNNACPVCGAEDELQFVRHSDHGEWNQCKMCEFKFIVLFKVFSIDIPNSFAYIKSQKRPRCKHHKHKAATYVVEKLDRPYCNQCASVYTEAGGENNLDGHLVTIEYWMECQSPSHYIPCCFYKRNSSC